MRRPGKARAVLIGLATALPLAACSLVASPATGCAEMDVSVVRCQAIVDAARERLGDHPPVAAVVVEPVTQGDRDTLRAQNLLVVVRFTFLDGSERRIDVHCGGRSASTLVCTERPTRP